MKRITQISVLFIALVAFSGSPLANEYTEVIDAADFEINDPFDLNLNIGYLLDHKTGTIRRETTEDPHVWDHYGYRNMFNYRHVQHILNFNLEVGIFRDLSIRFGLPLILNDSRELKKHKNWDGQWIDTDGDGVNEQLFNFPFKSPERSGVDNFSVGIWWSPLEQTRDDTKPTWTLFIEGRFGVGDTLEASCANGQNVPDPADRNGDGVWDSFGSRECDRIDKGGISRGVNELHFGTRLSRRFGILDPFFGFDVMIGWAKDGTPYYIEGNKSGQINTMPPVVGTLDFGMEIIPWEMPEHYRKFAIGIGAGATLHSEGRDYTPLFDALGTSPYFLDQAFVDYDGNGRADGGASGDEVGATSKWTGMTDIENYSTFFGRLFFLIQPAKYIKFRLGGGISHETEHFITKTDMCSADLMEVIQGATGECSRKNWGWRPELDTPGQRFRAEKTVVGNFFVDVTAMF